MSPGLVLFEDAGWRKLRPLTDTLPVPALAFGASTLGARLIARSGLPLAAIEARPDATGAWFSPPAAVAPAGADGVLAVNAAALPGPWLTTLAAETGSFAAFARGRLAAARLTAAEARGLLGRGPEFADRLTDLGLPRRALDAEVAMVEYPWNLIEWNAAAITEDLAHPGGHSGEVHPTAVLLSPGHIEIAAGARVDPLAVLDARGGPIAIGPRAVIQSHTLVVGPCVVGEGSHLLGGAVSGSTIGPECRLAGEIEASIWQGWSNKRHHGFVGHSAIGEWVNLGALTTTSDLKNNYGAVRVWVDGVEVDSGNPKIGAIVGAHVKTGIGTLLPTGASVGVGANLFGGGRFVPKPVPAFSWWDGEHESHHEIERFLATARIAMSRRGRTLTAADERLLRALTPVRATP